MDFEVGRRHIIESELASIEWIRTCWDGLDKSTRWTQWMRTVYQKGIEDGCKWKADEGRPIMGLMDAWCESGRPWVAEEWRWRGRSGEPWCTKCRSLILKWLYFMVSLSFWTSLPPLGWLITWWLWEGGGHLIMELWQTEIYGPTTKHKAMVPWKRTS